MNIPEMKDYCVSETVGFMIEEPLEELPEYFRSWVELGKMIPQLVESHQLRDEVNKLPLLDHKKLESYGEKRLAYTILCFICNGYIWQEGDKGVVKVLPQQIAVPLCALSDELGLQPGLGYSAVVTYNWRKVDPEGSLDPLNLRVICAIPGGEQFTWFAMISHAVEMAAVAGIKAMLKGMNSVKNDDGVLMETCLDDINNSLISMKEALLRMSDKLTGDIFFNVLRPYFAGWGGEDNVLPDGLIYEGVSDIPRKLIGASAAQSCAVQSFDMALGVTHEEDKQAYLDNMRDYMPTEHRQFLEALGNAPSIREYIEDHPGNGLRNAYNKCLESLSKFRSGHLQMVTKYIVIPSTQDQRNKDHESVAQKGTGGSDLIPFLKSIRDTTVAICLKE